MERDQRWIDCILNVTSQDYGVLKAFSSEVSSDILDALVTDQSFHIFGLNEFTGMVADPGKGAAVIRTRIFALTWPQSPRQRPVMRQFTANDTRQSALTREFLIFLN